MQLSWEAIGRARAVLIAGPTASGKSAAALRLAEAAPEPAWIVNADAMQVYRGLRIMTARPGEADERRAPHRLYGHVPPQRRYSVGAWLDDFAAILREAERAGARVIAVGGTGLYLKALTEGLAAIPAVPAPIRSHWVERCKAEGGPALHAELAVRDPVSAAAIRPSDPQRVLRALEVLDATGLPLAHWQSLKAEPLLPLARAAAFRMELDRPALYARIEARFDAIVEAGGMEEVGALLAEGLDAELPAMKAIGVRELAAVLRGERPLESAVDAAKKETRRYAKRQGTWFRHQMPGWTVVAG